MREIRTGLVRLFSCPRERFRRNSDSPGFLIRMGEIRTGLLLRGGERLKYLLVCYDKS